MNIAVEIIDRGRGPQLSNSRITVLDVFYYLHRGSGWDIVHRAMPSLSREEFDVIAAYIDGHREELLEKDQQAEEFIRRSIEEQKAMGLYQETDESISLDERVNRLKRKMEMQMAERNGGHDPR